jgi:hypothetical protein
VRVKQKAGGQPDAVPNWESRTGPFRKSGTASQIPTSGRVYCLVSGTPKPGSETAPLKPKNGLSGPPTKSPAVSQRAREGQGTRFSCVERSQPTPLALVHELSQRANLGQGKNKPPPKQSLDGHPANILEVEAGPSLFISFDNISRISLGIFPDIEYEASERSVRFRTLKDVASVVTA